ncbi:tyrosine-type recombinase/integrase [Oceaniradius stylonematis]|uniref:tyrosine-type recombinase/integrase n=1 Tax=Oceaniradius stylonematis TaxID=2184161 RepID=UPI003B5B5E38
MAAGGADDHLDPVIDALGDKALGDIDQSLLDVTAAALFPAATPATRNRWFYTPVSAILKQAGDERTIRRPKGWRGKPRVHWMTPDQAGRILAAADADDAEFGVFLATLLYTGMRLSEATGLTLDRLNLGEAWAWTPKTKNGQPRLVHLPPVLVAALANHPRGLDRGADRTGERVFRFVKCGRLYTRIRRVRKAAGPDCAFVTFHTFRHTWATWMRRYGGLDTRGLVDTGAWRSMQSAAVYEHVVASEEAQRADALPDVTRATAPNTEPVDQIGGKSVEPGKRRA